MRLSQMRMVAMVVLVVLVVNLCLVKMVDDEKS